MNARVLLVILLLLAAFPLAAHGITDTTFGGSLSARMIPENPGPHTQTTVRLTSVEVDLKAANISWFLDGKRAKSGINAHEHTFRTGKIGEQAVLEIAVTADSGQIITKTITIVPQSVSVLSQANTYVPPLYRGKALASPDSSVRLTAVPDVRRASGARIPTRSLMYRWYDGFRSIGEGVGTQTIVVTAPTPPAQSDIRVIVSDTLGELVAERSFALESQAPSILFYQEHPSRGTLYEHALVAIDLTGEEEVIRAEPLFFSLEDVISFKWRLAGAPASADPEDLRLITLRNESGKAGLSILELIAQNTDKFLQTARRAIGVTFGRRAFETP